jgi:hypothetical protein
MELHMRGGIGMKHICLNFELQQRNKRIGPACAPTFTEVRSDQSTPYPDQQV